jgi:hypothetical protein
MSEDAKAAVLRQINRKIKQTQAAKYRHQNSPAYYSHVYEFFKKIEETYKMAGNGGEFNYLLNIEGLKLINKLQLLDPAVSIKMEWNDTDDWTQLRIQGLTITWSPEMLINNPQISITEYIDVLEMMLA